MFLLKTKKELGNFPCKTMVFEKWPFVFAQNCKRWFLKNGHLFCNSRYLMHPLGIDIIFQSNPTGEFSMDES